MAAHLGIYRVGNCIIDLYEEQDGYCGTIFAEPTTDPADRVAWRFDGLRGPAIGLHDERRLAIAACSFGGYFTSDNRGGDVPAWAPAPEVADAICSASCGEDEAEELPELPAWCVALQEGKP